MPTRELLVEGLLHVDEVANRTNIEDSDSNSYGERGHCMRNLALVP